MSKMVKTASLGMPRIGRKCEVPLAVNQFLTKKISATELQSVGKAVRDSNTEMQIENGIDIIPCNDFSFFDHILDTTVLLGNIPRKYYWEGGAVSLDVYFIMITGQQRDKFDVTPMSVSRWFNTNYLYVVPELADPIEFVYSDNKHVLSYLEAKQKFNVKTRPVFFGPVSYILMSKIAQEDIHDISKNGLVDEIIPVYEELLVNCKRVGITDIQFDEPMLTQDLTREEQAIYRDFYNKLALKNKDEIKIHLTTAYGEIGNNIECAVSLPVNSIHLDLCYGPNQLDHVLDLLPDYMSISLGLVDSQNVWVNDLSKSIAIAEKAIKRVGKDRVIIAPSSSLFLCPLDVMEEEEIPSEIDGLISFTRQKLGEVSIIAKILNEGVENSKDLLKENKEKIAKINAIAQQINVAGDPIFSEIVKNDNQRKSSFKERISEQKKVLFGDTDIPFPMTMNGSMPTSGSDITIENAVKLQEKFDFNVISDAELDRNSNAEFLAKNLTNFFIPKEGYVQHYGSITNKAIVCYGIPKIKDVNVYTDIASSLRSFTSKPIKVILSGPISFVNQSCFPIGTVSSSAKSIMAKIIKDEVARLQANGVQVIGIDEESFLQGLPLRDDHVADAMVRIVNILKYTYKDLDDKTQVHTRVLHGHFENYLEDLALIDSDVLLINSARGGGEIFESFISYRYPNYISLGIYDSWSNRIPLVPEINAILKKYTRALELEQVWVAPDFGFHGKTNEHFSKVMQVVSQVILDARQK